MSGGEAAKEKTGLFGRLFTGGDTATSAFARKPVEPDTVDAETNATVTDDQRADVTAEGASPAAAEQPVEPRPTPVDPDAAAVEASAVSTATDAVGVGQPEPEPEPEPEPVSAPVAVPTLVTQTPIVALPEPAKTGWFGRLTGGLAKTSGKLTEGITGIFTKKKLGAETLDDLEDILLQADLGVDTAMRITDALSKGRYAKGISADDVRNVLAEEVERVLLPVAVPLTIERRDDGAPFVILVSGVNGAGKTTTIGKLAQKFKADGFSVMLAAGDTFRAAAVEQLKIWGDRTNTPVISKETGADAAGLAFDALDAAAAQNIDILMIDTAGRLQNKTELMAELEKVIRVIRKRDPSAPHAGLLVLDATTGQNALNQVEVFREKAAVTGLIMTKLDGTARGGILVAIAAKFGLPVHAIGVGEGIDDLQPFAARDFADALSSSA